MRSLRRVAFGFGGLLIWAGVFAIGGSLLSASDAAATSAPVVISSPTVTACASATDGCTSVVLPARGPLPSTFDTPTVPVTVTNEGSLTLTEMAMSLSAVTSGASGLVLEDGLNVCIHHGTTVWANGPLIRGLGATPSIVLTGVTLGKKGTPGPTADTFDVSYYVGENSACGHVVSTNATDAATWSTPSTGTYATPPSLDNPAEGATVTVTMAVDFAAIVPGGVTKGTTSTGTSPGSSGGASSTPVGTATGASSGGALAFTGLDIALFVGVGGLLLLTGIGLLFWTRRSSARR